MHRQRAQIVLIICRVRFLLHQERGPAGSIVGGRWADGSKGVPRLRLQEPAEHRPEGEARPVQIPLRRGHGLSSWFVSVLF